MTPDDPAWTLAVTCRCLTEDLGLTEQDCDLRISVLADRHRVIADFIKKRGTHPIGVERIEALLPKLIAYSLHSGRYRAATWHQERAGIVWLLAAGWHEQGSEDDAYLHFERLLTDGRIQPTRADVERVVTSRRLTFERALLEDIPNIRRRALSVPREVVETEIGRRVRVRVAYENGDTGLLFVAITQRLFPGDIAVIPAFLAFLIAFGIYLVRPREGWPL